MRSKKGGARLKLLFLAFCLALIAGCSVVQFGPRPNFGTTWVSTNGTPSEQLHDDQAECRRDTVLMTPPGLPLSGGTGGEGWGYSEMRAFDNCMKAKGWVRK